MPSLFRLRKPISSSHLQLGLEPFIQYQLELVLSHEICLILKLIKKSFFVFASFNGFLVADGLNMLLKLAYNPPCFSILQSIQQESHDSEGRRLQA